MHQRPRLSGSKLASNASKQNLLCHQIFMDRMKVFITSSSRELVFYNNSLEALSTSIHIKDLSLSIMQVHVTATLHRLLEPNSFMIIFKTMNLDNMIELQFYNASTQPYIHIGVIVKQYRYLANRWISLLMLEAYQALHQLPLLKPGTTSQLERLLPKLL